MASTSSGTDNGCLICGRTSDVVSLGVYSEYAGEGARQGERVWICEECAQIEEYARAFVIQAREQFSIHGGGGWQGQHLPETSVAFSYRIVSPVLRSLTDEHGVNRFHAWTIDI
jgi:hypothetical protein